MSTLDRRSEAAQPAPQPAPRANLPRLLLKALRLPLLLVALAATLLGANWWLAVGRFQESTDNATIAGDIALIASRLDGQVAEILVADNATVVAGQPLIRLDDRDWRARLAEAGSGTAAAGAALATARAQLAQQDALIAQAAAGIAQARAEAARARADAARAQNLAGQGWTSRQAMDRAEADTQKADAAVLAAQAAAAAAEGQKQVLAAQVAQAQAALARATATEEVARVNLEFTLIRAPFAGQVGNRAAQPGQQVRPGTVLIAIAPDAARLYVLANFKETQLSRMRPGQPVRIGVDALGGAVLEGRVDSLAPATGALFSVLPPENATGNFTKIVQRVPVRIVIDAAPQGALLRPGLSAVPSVDTRDDPAAPRTLLGAARARLPG